MRIFRRHLSCDHRREQRWFPVGGGFSGCWAGGTTGGAVHGGLGLEAHPQASPEAAKRIRDYEQLVQQSEG